MADSVARVFQNHYTSVFSKEYLEEIKNEDEWTQCKISLYSEGGTTGLKK